MFKIVADWFTNHRSSFSMIVLCIPHPCHGPKACRINFPAPWLWPQLFDRWNMTQVMVCQLQAQDLRGTLYFWSPLLFFYHCQGQAIGSTRKRTMKSRTNPNLRRTKLRRLHSLKQCHPAEPSLDWSHLRQHTDEWSRTNDCRKPLSLGDSLLRGNR